MPDIPKQDEARPPASGGVAAAGNAAEKGQKAKPREARDIPYDPFFLDKVFPDASAIFSFVPKPLTELTQSALVFLDANVLLAPFEVNSEQIPQLEEIYGRLVAGQRLWIPGRAAREYARHRLRKLARLIGEWGTLDPKSFRFREAAAKPIVSHLKAFEGVVEIESKFRELQQSYESAFAKVRQEIIDWQTDDPVAGLYRKLFKGIVVETKLSRDQLIADTEWRNRHEVPPGFEDKEKPDKGIGDRIIWHSIVEKCQNEKRDAIFVTLDLKDDWTHKDDKSGQLFARYELVEEFRSKTNGCTFALLSFSRFLVMMKASRPFVEQVEKLEEARAASASSTDRPMTVEERQELGRVQQRSFRAHRIREYFGKLSLEELERAAYEKFQAGQPYSTPISAYEYQELLAAVRSLKARGVGPGGRLLLDMSDQELSRLWEIIALADRIRSQQQKS